MLLLIRLKKILSVRVHKSCYKNSDKFQDKQETFHKNHHFSITSFIRFLFMLIIME